MEGKGPYRIYDPGGGTPEEASAAFERLVEENTKLKEKMQGIKSLGELLEESQLEASRLRQKVEDLVKDNEMLRSTSSLDKLAEIAGGVPDRCSSPVAPSEAQKELEKVTQKPSSSGSSSEFEIVGAEEKRSSQGSSRKSDTEPLQNEDIDLMLHLQRLENTLSVFAEESDKTQLFAHLGRMALEFNRLSSKVHKNEQKTSILQALCEQLRNENEELRAKLEKELEQRNQASEKLRCENLELRKMVMMGSKEGMKGEGIESAGKQQGAVVEKATGKNVLGTSEKKVKILEHQRNELLEVNKQWDHHFRSMKQQYEQKITDLRQKLADSQKAQGELETEREHKQRDFDRKLLLAKSKIEEEEAERERLNGEVKDLKQRVKFLQDQLAPVTRQREYQEKEILRLNKALEEALNFQASAASAFNSPIEPSMSIRHQEVMTQNELLKQQVKIFEEDFQRERSDRERMNEEKEALKQQLEKVQKQLMLTNNQLRIFKEDYQKEKEEKDKLKKLLKQHKQHSGDRLHPEPQPGPVAPVCPMYQFPCSPPGQPHIYHGYEDWQQIRYPPSPMANERPVQNYHRFPPPEYTWCQPCVISQNQNSQAVDGVKQLAKESDPTALGLPKSQRPT
ncbi:TNFAIP3-interacting protein 1 isoform X2 [Hemicordylus capensis]|uniref:TNFAIP3-interacting protein 1 isoform X2 n=1 Tax=Hemicordylus capensis TaxID=884348 RepID=UPI00230252F8|nr:TNFAIP3-interacting protein 1 isoform X2 [Hemicordylus capensis]